MKISFFLLSLCFCLPAFAQEGPRPFATLQKSVELPSHRSLLSVVNAPDSALAPFETDGCSGGLSTTWSVVADLFPGFADAHENRPPWEDCCVAHDRLYHDAAGAETAEESYDARLAADEELRACVVAGSGNRADKLAEIYDATPEQVTLAYRTIGDAMFNAVRFGGAPCSGLPWRWGFGYPGCIPLLD